MALTAAQRKKKNDRALARREALKGSAVDVDTGQSYEIQVLDHHGPRDRKQAPVVEENLKILRIPKAEAVRTKAVRQRVRYASMQTHMEMAAHVIAAGGTTRQAAEKAGISRRQVRKYMEGGDFRDRIMELQETLGGRIRGRIIKEINKRTGPKYIEKMELLDMLRVGDRFGLGRGNGSVIVNDNREVHNYEANFNALFHAEDSKLDSDTEEEGADFPEFEPTSLALSGGDSPVEG